jgi:glycosyltransferase involved in cell wall biosynthesis
MVKTSKNDINVLYLIDKSTYLTKMSRVRFHAMEALGEITNLVYWGPGWDDFDTQLPLSENIQKIEIQISYIICYKAAEIKQINEVDIPICITYNEMYDKTSVLDEINVIKPSLIICHHENDLINFQKSALKDINFLSTFKHIPHCVDKSIFYNKNLEREIDILLCGVISKRYTKKERLIKLIRLPLVSLGVLFPFINRSYDFKANLIIYINIITKGYAPKHYPLRDRFIDVLKLIPDKYNTVVYKHPGSNKGDAHTDIYPREFSDAINRAKICLTCTSKYKYRLAKMVEVPACGSALASDIPNQDEESFNDLIIKIDSKMSDRQIAEKLVYYLEHKNELARIANNGYKWSQKYTQQYYAEQILSNLKQLENKNVKIYVLSEDLKTLKNKWICDVLKDEFLEYSNLNFVENPKDADIIWLLAPWAHSKINKKYLDEKFVITTMHHIDKTKYPKNKNYYKYIDGITNRYHTICPKSYSDLRSITQKEIVVSNFWINKKNFYKIDDKKSLRVKHNIPENALIIGSFQKDTEGKGYHKPKLSKGPDIFIDIIKDLKKTNNRDLFVVLTGWRRAYIINKLNELKINYVYHELVDTTVLNELYNCLDLYIVSSRVEGGPRAILEASAAKTPIISTNVGISELVLHEESIYDMNNPTSYRLAKANSNYAYEEACEYSIDNYMKTFIKKVFFEIK